MRLKSNPNGFTLAMIFALAAAMLLGTAVMNAETADDPAKQIERKLAKLKRDMEPLYKDDYQAISAQCASGQ